MSTYFATADNTFVLVVAKGTFVAYSHECRWPHVAVAYGTLAVALVAEPADGDARLFAAHDEIAKKKWQRIRVCLRWAFFVTFFCITMYR